LSSELGGMEVEEVAVALVLTSVGRKEWTLKQKNHF
jgi:hypothetical protein